MFPSRLFVSAFVIFLLGLFLAFRINSVSNQNMQLREFGPIDIKITLKDSPKVSNQYQIIESGKLRVFADIYPRFQVGDVIRVRGEANSEGLVFRPEIKKIGRSESWLTKISDLRLEISSRIDQLLPSREATLVKGMVLGVDEIEKSFREQLIATGTIHAVVVSGQNLSIVAGFFMVFVKCLGRRLSMIMAIFGVLFYALLTGFEVPVVRALIMVVLSSGAVFLGRERLAVWNLTLSAILILLVWPEAIFDVSFQLTFAATLGIMTLGQRLNRITNYKNPITKLLIGNAAVATSAYLFTAPIIFWHFGRLSLIAPLVNVLVAEAVVPIMVLGFAVAIASLIFMPFAQILALFAFVQAFYFVKLVEIFS